MVARAAAKVSRERVADLVLVRRRVFPQERHECHEDSRRAKAALQPVRFAERRLNRVQRAVSIREPFHSGQLLAIGLDRKHQTRSHSLAIQQHRARAADAMLAAYMRTG